MDSKLAKEGREHTRATGRKTAIELVEEILPKVRSLSQAREQSPKLTE